MNRQLLVFLLLLLSQIASAQRFDWNSAAVEAYGHILDLRFQKADTLLRSMRKEEPDNLCAPYLEDLRDFLIIVVTDDRNEFEKRVNAKDSRIAAFERAPHNDPFKNIALGELQLHWAFADLRFGNHLSGAMGVRRAFGLLEDNMQRFPYFIQTNKGMGLLHTLVGTVPDNYRWAARLIGLDGTISQGMEEMGRIIKGHSGRPEFASVQKETLFLFTFLQINLLNEPSALTDLLTRLQPHSGPLMDFAKARVLQKKGDTDSAIGVLQASLKNRPNAFPYLHYLLGDLRLARLDQDADIHFMNYLRIFKGDNYVSAAHGKLGWHALVVKQNKQDYQRHLTKALETDRGLTDEDKAMRKEAVSGRVPSEVLLRARLLFDGGYHERALEELMGASASSFPTKEDRLERDYRLARIHHSLGNQQEAISMYQSTMREGAESTRYFAANAALQLGLLFEQKGEKQRAREAFVACSSFKNTEYRDSINQKAKAGLNRLGSKPE
jgi:tetratricopeptide (TPR) repeat protein